MTTITDVLQQIIGRTPFLEEGLSDGIVNISSLARKLKPEIEEKTFKSVSEAAIIMALNRLLPHLSDHIPIGKTAIIGDLVVRSNLMEFTFANSPHFILAESKLIDNLHVEADIFINYAHGVRETTIIINNIYVDLLRNLFHEETLIHEIANVSSITMQLAPGSIETPGIFYRIFKALAWEDIVILEVNSTNSELTIFFNDQDIERAFAVLKRLTK